MNANRFQVLKPHSGEIYVERSYADKVEIEKKVSASLSSRSAWAKLAISERGEVCRKAVNFLLSKADEIGIELSNQMGRPIRYTPNEIRGGLKERAEYMIEIASEALKDVKIDSKRFIKRQPVGTVLVLAPWNYPFLTSVNAIIPALMAGNTVILKHSEQTPLVAERYKEAFDYGGLPSGVFDYLHITHAQVADLIRDKRISYVAFTGSVEGGKAVQEALSSRFIGAGLELGGKDPAYVRADAQVDFAVENCVDGAFFNSGQSCCGIERIYVHETIYNSFVSKFVELTKAYKMGDPLDPESEIGPLCNPRGVRKIIEQRDAAIEAGARALIQQNQNQTGNYLYPEVLVDVDHSMAIMQEESFGPIVCIMPVKDDQEAIDLMNDSEYGLTASIWTQDVLKAQEIGDALETGTVFMNRCDYLDPALAWTGVKNSGKGATLSSIGYEALTRPKSFHFRLI